MIELLQDLRLALESFERLRHLPPLFVEELHGDFCAAFSIACRPYDGRAAGTEPFFELESSGDHRPRLDRWARHPEGRLYVTMPRAEMSARPLAIVMCSAVVAFSCR